MQARVWRFGWLMICLGLGAVLQGNENPAAPTPSEPVFPPVYEGVPETPFDAPEGTWTLAIVPDTQFYLVKKPEVYARQLEWIVRHRESHRILFAAHEGDVTNDNGEAQWRKAREITSILNRGGVPYLIVTGNHDLGPKGKTGDRSTGLRRHFSESDYSNSPKFGVFEAGKIENSWHEIATPTGVYLILDSNLVRAIRCWTGPTRSPPGVPTRSWSW